MKPTEEWLKKWEKNRLKLTPPTDLNEYFEKDCIAGQSLVLFDLGLLSLPTGEFLVRDPLVYLSIEEEPYFQKIPTGTFPLTVCAVVSEEDCARYAAVKATFNDNKAVRFEEALVGHEDFEGVEDGNFFGFSVDAGLATIVDVKTRDAFCDFYTKWEKENTDEDKDLYTNYFAPLFSQSYRENPEYQRTAGDWINWTIPGTNLHMPIFQSGFGDGTYPVYIGYDENNHPTCIIVHLIDIEFEFTD